VGVNAVIPDAVPVPFPDQRLPRRQPRTAHTSVWIRVAGSWRAGQLIAWVRVGEHWCCWTRHEDPAAPIHGHSEWYRYDPVSIRRHRPD
jgi:hypothetical protein